MRAMKTGLSCMAILVAGMVMRADAAPVFVNGGFEAATGSAPGWIEVVPFFSAQVWTSIGGVPAAEGINALWMGHTDTGGASHLIQTVGGFTVGNAYELSFAMQAERGAADGRPGSFLGLSLTGASVPSTTFSVVYPGTSPFFGGAFVTQSLIFTATATSVTFDFNGLDPVGGSWESGLDDFRLADVNVPEPTSIALLGIGLAAVGGAQARRKQKTKLSA